MLAEYALYVGRSQLMQLVLNAGALFAPQDGYIWMQVIDQAGNDVFGLVALVGDAVSDQSVFLVPGEYRVRFTAGGFSGPPPAMTYRLRGLNLTDPIGPAAGDSLLNPQYICEDDPTLYCYPGSVISTIPFLLQLLS